MRFGFNLRKIGYIVSITQKESKKIQESGDFRGINSQKPLKNAFIFTGNIVK